MTRVDVPSGRLPKAPAALHRELLGDRPTAVLSGGALAGEPVEGALEELDGTPIATARPPRRPSVPWGRAARAAAATTAGRPWLWAYALAAFLARGGVLALTLPIVVLPTFIGLANLVGPASVSAAGPGPRLVAMIVAIGTVFGVLAVAGTFVAAAAETALHRATVAPGIGPASGQVGDLHPPPAPGPGDPAGRRGTAGRVAALRLLLLVPVVAATAVAVPAWVTVAYRELTLPGDLAVPLLVRVLAGAPAASVLVVATWLAAEVVGGFAARRAVLLGASVARALAGGLLDPLRAPLGTALGVAAALGVTLVVLAPAMWAIAAAWELARRALVDDAGALAALGTALLLAGAWLAALLLAAVTAAWRANLMTAELLRRG